ncbi:hypothetical protein [uncultured Intestinimonas sp.]|uniref:hypothetical protein n=1 Tax=uncultured Intestinimonas sp. TaxID=1689265 RepID=UPI0025F827E1|nr:hypothetical protein [uncultured Intestinimonas sp.]
MELRNSSGDRLYQGTITEGRYDLRDGLRFYLKGTVDEITPSAASTNALSFQITDDATGEVVDYGVPDISGQLGSFTYTPSGYSPDGYGPFSKGRSYTVTFQ